ncbi:MAG: imidazole glycerol phosphate synthase subunit HisH [Bacteroidetes bacterium]|nr:MAG: imidazole glycerol phosphate synthase subunit HisH [Bacteroidota bacterium]
MIAIINYNAGNIRSVQNALTRLGYESVLTDDPATIRAAEKVIFPGVGEAKSAMQQLKAKGLDQVVKSLTQPVLGICLGLQLMCESSEEGHVDCLGIFPHKVLRFRGEAIVPHMGWNNFESLNSALCEGLDITANVYYVHSYYAELGAQTSAVCHYITPFSAILEKANFYATQFHPEKSADIGNLILKNFLAL